MKVIYDKESDTLSIILSDAKVAESDEAREGLILDYDRAGRLVSIELLDASEQVRAPQSVEFALAAAEPEATLLREKPARRYGRP
ncbi:MAG: DUF2283 domain-containing protein [Planctomycetes bacterium]|nr:DUF2283 domain-containing protein [Planctomycetota bacterium]MBM4082259.1 DUF2283 domain-containing protein [Planctomycetota bacterium]